MSWESPVNITDRIVDYQTKQIDDMIVADVQKVIETHIDKEALLDALNGSREQYEKGYTEGCDKVYSEIKQAVDEISDEGAYFHEIEGDTDYVKGISFCLRILDKYFYPDKIDKEKES